MEVFGIKLVGMNPENGQKLLMTVIFITSIILIKSAIAMVMKKGLRGSDQRKVQFWARQGLNLLSAFVIFLSVLSIWFDDPTRLATGLGLMTAGLAFALQKVVTSFAGYLLIMRGNTFSVGERITMGGIRGDVISLGFLQTTIMEMGQPPTVQGADPAMWVKSRQFTGRIVTVTNDKIFDQAVYNYTREFPFIWEELSIPIKYTADRDLVEQILLDVVGRHTKEINEMSNEQRQLLDDRFGVKTDDMIPKVFYRLTDNWLELSVRFITTEHGVRGIKDRVSREVIRALDEAEIEIASATFELVGMPTLKLEPAKIQQASAPESTERNVPH